MIEVTVGKPTGIALTLFSSGKSMKSQIVFLVQKNRLVRARQVIVGQRSGRCNNSMKKKKKKKELWYENNIMMMMVIVIMMVSVSTEAINRTTKSYKNAVSEL